MKTTRVHYDGLKMNLQKMIIEAKLYILSAFLLFLWSCNTSEVPSLPVNKIEGRECYNVAFLIMDGVYNTEFTAPFDIFQHTIFRQSIKPMCVFSVADKDEPVVSFEGLKIIPDYNYLTDELPKIDILVVPSAEHHLDTDLENKAMLKWINQVSQKAKFVTSHCDGAFILAEAGLLEGLVSTTFPSDVDEMRKRYPHLDIRDSVLFVHDGKVITSAGGAKSFEAALYVCDIMYGKDISRSLAKGLVIDWKLNEVPHLVIKKNNH
jgi:transcriptional regulator GlxA family with amidase domain